MIKDPDTGPTGFVAADLRPAAATRSYGAAGARPPHAKRRPAKAPPVRNQLARVLVRRMNAATLSCRLFKDESFA